MCLQLLHNYIAIITPSDSHIILYTCYALFCGGGDSASGGAWVFGALRPFRLVSSSECVS